jgi:hypothetical protein
VTSGTGLLTQAFNTHIYMLSGARGVTVQARETP